MDVAPSLAVRILWGMGVTKHVAAHWDAKARVWWADSDDIPGLVTEAATFEGLIARAGAVIPELLADIGMPGETVTVEYRSDESSDVELIGRQTFGAPMVAE